MDKETALKYTNHDMNFDTSTFEHQLAGIFDAEEEMAGEEVESSTIWTASLSHILFRGG